ncbi:MAG: flagellar biosynthetic protein FliO [Bdellovibrionales bacterium]|nr:flagellar biosynthetic protein FliO [Bdellovibrionales bacterium]
MKSQGWHKQFVFAFLVGLLTYQSVFAGTQTIREITLAGDNGIEIQFDSPISKKMLDYDYVRDIAQLTIRNATIYPARILHPEKKTFNKVFAYQYAPSLVRVRFNVEGQASQFQGKIISKIDGNRLTVKFPLATVAAPVVAEEKSAKKDDDSNDRALLDKVLASSDDKDEKPVKEEKKSKTEKSLTGNKKSNSPAASLGGAKPGQSVFRSIMAMALIVGGLGLVLVWVKRKKTAQATRVGNGWLSSLIPQGMRKQKSLIEVVGQQALGPKQSITVVRIRGQQFVLGVSQDSVHLISQIDSNEDEVGLLDDPAVAAGLGKMFGSTPTKDAPTSNASAGEKGKQSIAQSFANLLKFNDGESPGQTTTRVTQNQGASATAAIARNRYNIQVQAGTFPTQPVVAPATPAVSTPSVRDQIRKRLEGARS